MSPEPQLKRVLLHEQVYSILRERIVSGEIAPGESVKDGQVALSLGASRTPVREALVRLTSEGLMLNAVGRGFRAPPLLRQDVLDAHPLLTSLEPMALAAAGACSAARYKQLEKLNLRMERAAGKPQLLNELDSQWHRCLIGNCPNARLLKYVEELRDVLRRYELAHLDQSEGLQPSTSEHAAIAEAEATGERGRALELLTDHWQRGRDELLARVPGEES
jgi:DNA-binding GntR family transcriptional regulator